MSKIKELKEDRPKRQAVRDLIYSALAEDNLTVGQIEDFINGIIDIAVKEIKDSI